MIDRIRTLSAALLLALLLSPAAMADDAQDRQVEVGVKAYDDGDYQRAKDILLPLAEAGHPKAMNMVGLMHYDTPVFPNDPIVECDWYERSAKAGFASGMYNLSICHSQGSGRIKDHAQMLYWRTMAANNGSTNAMINLASLDKSEGKVFRQWMRKAAENGSTYAKVDLWLQGYKEDVPNVTFRDILCVSWRILILNGSFKACD